jgi:uncharacterized protein
LGEQRLTPFLVTGGPVPPEDVVDREAYLERTIARLKDGHSIYISGPRRIGKSSIAGALLEHFREAGFYTCQLDLFTVTSETDFAERLAEAVLVNRRGGWRLSRRQVSLEPSLSAKGFPPEIKVALGFKVGSPDPEPSVILDRALELPEQVASQDKRGMVVAFDEFQEVQKLGGIDLLKRMRAHFQQHRSVVYIFLGSESSKLRQIFGAAAEPFYRFAEPSRLPPIPLASWSEYLEARFASRDLTIPVAILTDLLEATGGHPADTMLVASHVYYATRDSRSGEVTGALLQAGYAQALDDLSQYFDVIWAGLNRPTRSAARGLVETGQPYAGGQEAPAAIARAMRTLEELGIALRDGPRRWAVAEPMFADWLRRL